MIWTLIVIFLQTLKCIWSDFPFNTWELIKSNGYPYENYTVTTVDGYILALHRIPHGKTVKNESQKSATVYLQHGLMGASHDFLINEPYTNSLAFILADNNMDVWLGDFRGNKYSKKHISLSSNSDEYWDWSFHELAQYDVPALTDVVKRKSATKTFYYIGHSIGALAGFLHYSHFNPSKATDVSLMFAVCPLVYVDYMRSNLKSFNDFTGSQSLLDKLVGKRDFNPSKTVLEWLALNECSVSDVNLCETMLYILGGPSIIHDLNTTRIPYYEKYFPAGTSVKTIAHIMQGIDTGAIREFDYGLIDNLKKYQQIAPPDYDLTKMRIGTVLMTDDLDWLSHPKDVRRLTGILPKIVYKQSYDDVGLFNPLFGQNASATYYNFIVSVIQKHADGILVF